MFRLLALLSCIVLASPLAAVEAKQPRPLRVLFVGNSYTYTNALPQVVALVAESRGLAMSAGMLAEPDFALEDHIVTGAYDAMLERGWDWVVLQQGPSSLPQNRLHLRVWSERAAASARARGIRVALMSAWPALGNIRTWTDAELSYHLAAVAAQACVLPVATAWRLARATQFQPDLYDGDLLHPSRTGTLLAALVAARALVPGVHKPGALDIGIAFDDPYWGEAVRR
ncbi:MAG TPA: hypothetical protein VFO79_13270, partial [Xanthomonadales bacterium]|nr:hypothetical protein [Xanthomonadales bacterium]